MTDQRQVRHHFMPKLSHLSDESWMRRALGLAERAEHLGEVPIGAVLVVNNELVAEGWNQPLSTNDPTAHAEIVALRAAAARLNNYQIGRAHV